MVGQACFGRTLEDLKHDLRMKYDLTYDDAGTCVRYAADTVRVKRRAPDFVRGYYTEEQAEAELNKRIRAIDDGREKTIPWEEVKEHLRERFLDADEHLPAEEPTEWHMTTSGKFLLPEFEPVDVIGRALYWEDVAQQYERYVRRLAVALGTSENEQPDTIVERAIVRLRGTE
jgi:Putative addiction module component